MQKDIYDHAKSGNLDQVHHLQEILIESQDAKFLAAKRVTSDNKGKNTAGIDGKKFLNPQERFLLAENLSLNDKSDPVVRVYIPKPGTDEKRALGIPTMEDRAKQALAKLALEPQMEAVFEPHSFGFRPGRKGADATWQIRHKLKYGPLWVYDADIKKCFDRISHKSLLEKIPSTEKIKTQVKAWLEAGIFEKGEAFPSTGVGTPQGGVISPLLANIALDGAQNRIWESVYKSTGNKKKANKVLYIRYADDFIILSPDKDWLGEGIRAVEAHISLMGLEIKTEKTRIVHTDPSKGRLLDIDSHSSTPAFGSTKLSMVK